MLKYILSNEALSFLQRIPAKHAKQIMEKIEKISNDPKSVPSKQLEGFPALKRFKSGEYRIIYRIDQNILTILVLRIGKRNDGAVYKKLDSLKSDEKP
jgi:mRNA interferase RelE/StbE